MKTQCRVLSAEHLRKKSQTLAQKIQFHGGLDMHCILKSFAAKENFATCLVTEFTTGNTMIFGIFFIFPSKLIVDNSSVIKVSYIKDHSKKLHFSCLGRPSQSYLGHPLTKWTAFVGKIFDQVPHFTCFWKWASGLGIVTNQEKQKQKIKE